MLSFLLPLRLPLSQPCCSTQLKLLPEELNQILIITVVFSMALTPALAALGSKLGDAVEALEANASSIDEDRAAPKKLEVCRIGQAWFLSAMYQACGLDNAWRVSDNTHTLTVLSVCLTVLSGCLTVLGVYSTVLTVCLHVLLLTG
jgi:hypothetical protein